MRVLITGGNGQLSRTLAPFEFVLCSALAAAESWPLAELEIVQSYTSGDIVVLVVIERQHGQVGGLPDQDWSLRVTLVFRREGPEWRLLHRQADPLLHGISLEQLAALARG